MNNIVFKMFTPFNSTTERQHYLESRAWKCFFFSLITSYG